MLIVSSLEDAAAAFSQHNPAHVISLLSGDEAPPSFDQLAPTRHLKLCVESEACGQAIDSAARKVCHMDDMRTVTRLKSRERQQCYDKARASAANQIASIVEQKQLGG